MYGNESIAILSILSVQIFFHVFFMSFLRCFEWNEVGEAGRREREYFLAIKQKKIRKIHFSYYSGAEREAARRRRFDTMTVMSQIYLNPQSQFALSSRERTSERVLCWSTRTHPPLNRQTTMPWRCYSIWKDGGEMKNYFYYSKLNVELQQKTRIEGWGWDRRMFWKIWISYFSDTCVCAGWLKVSAIEILNTISYQT